MSSYFGCCAMCRFFNLYDKYGKYSKSFRCTKFDRYREFDEKACIKFEPAQGRNVNDFDKAIENRL